MSDITTSSAFTGTFTDELRQNFRQHRLSLDLTLSQTGEFFGVHWTTVSKWESGTIKMCHPCHRNLISSFLSGEYDSWLGHRIKTVQGKRRHEFLPAFHDGIMHLMGIFHMLAPHPDLQNLLANRLNGVVNSIMLQRLSRLKQ